MHDPRYAAAVAALAAEGRLRLESPDEDLYALISGADVVVVMPFSSPAYAASALGVPAIYYDPTEQLVPNQDPAPGVTFVSGREALGRAVVEALSAGIRRP